MLDPGALDVLRAKAHETLATLTGEVCDEAGVAPAEVYEIVVAGNVTMIQIALGIDPEPLSMAPFTIAARQLPAATAAELGVRVHERAPAVLFPALGAYVGPDIVAGILATGLTLDKRLRLFIDVGTNSEIVLGSSGSALATAAPAGPAFEAAQIRCGMRAADGAIEGVKIVDDEVELTVIGDVEPAGLCGSGLVDAVAELVGAGILDHSGRFVPGSSEHARARSARRTSSICPATSFSRSETCASCSLRRRRSRPAGRSSATTWASSRRRSPRCCSAARSAPYLTAASAVKIGLVPKLAADAHRLGGQRRRRGREDRGPVGDRARGRERGARRGRLRRAVGPHRLQRPVHRPAEVSRNEPGRRRLRGAGARTSTRSRSAAAGRSRCGRCRPSCTTGPSASAPAVDAARGDVVAYADCGTRGALDDLPRLPGADCYQLFGGMEHEPGTYYLTDFLVRSFDRVVVARARARPPSRAARRVLPPLRARRLARPGADARAARAGPRPLRRQARAAARASRDRRHRSRACPRTTTSGRPDVLINELPRYEILDEHSMQELDRGWRRIVSRARHRLPARRRDRRARGRRAAGRRPARQVRSGLDPRAGGEGAARVRPAGAQPGEQHPHRRQAHGVRSGLRLPVRARGDREARGDLRRLREPRASLAGVPAARHARRDDLRAERQAARLPAPRHGLRAADALRQAVHGLGDLGPERRSTRSPWRRWSSDGSRSKRRPRSSR